MAGAPNDVSYKNNTHIPGIPIHYFQKDAAEWPKWTRFDRQHRGDFTLQLDPVSRVTGIPGWYWILGIKCSDTMGVGLVY